MRNDRQYLADKASELRAQGLQVTAHLALGDPSTDLIAMTAHGHRFLGDLVFGSTIHEVRHKSTVPVLIVRTSPKKAKS